jgi:peptidoglycan/LPS O-acetylase OafA/YrhL
MENKQSFFLPQLNGLRFIAFFMVFLIHAPFLNFTSNNEYLKLISTWYNYFNQHLGNSGVDLFFCLSAFLITKLLLIENDKYGSFSIGRFLKRRILRIFPLYYLMLFLGFVVIPIFYFNNTTVFPVSSDVHQNILKLTLVPHLLFFANNTALVTGSPNEFLAPLWSLSIEQQFYVIFPLILYYFVSKKENVFRDMTYFLIFALLLTTAIKFYYIGAGYAHPKIYLSSMTRLDCFIFGTFVALKNHYHPTILKIKFQPLIGSLVLGLNLSLPTPYAAVPHLWIPLSYLSNAVGFSLILDYLVRNSTSTFSKILSVKPLLFLGNVSYGLYVFHIMGFRIANEIHTKLQMNVSGIYYFIYLLIAFLITLGFATVSYYCYELPFLRLKNRFTTVTRTNNKSA